MRPCDRRPLSDDRVIDDGVPITETRSTGEFTWDGSLTLTDLTPAGCAPRGPTTPLS